MFPSSMPETSICGLASEVRVGPSPDPDPNLPPESVRVSIHSVGGVYERDDSAKESTNPKSNNNPSTNHNAKGAAGGSRSNSQRGTNLQAEGPIIGLPARIRHVSCSVSRRPPPPSTSSRIFPKKKKKAVPESEPTSPKVSCFGKVSSDRERVERTNKKRDPIRKPPGWWAHLAVFFLSCAGGGGGRRRLESLDDGVTEEKSSNAKKITTSVAIKPAAGPTEEPAVPGLGGMKRFASGRRPAAWASEGEFEIDRDAVLARRSVGSIQEGWKETE